MRADRYVAVIDRDAAPAAVNAVHAAVSDAHEYRFLPLIAFGGDEATANRVAQVAGVQFVVVVPDGVIDAESIVNGIDVLLGVAEAQRTGDANLDLYGGTDVTDPYPILRSGSPQILDLDDATSLFTPPAAMVAVNLSVGPRSVTYETALEDPVNLATLALAQNQLVVMAAGNDGHGERETMSAWAEMEWVLAVGATVDADGRRLADTSSRGVPEDHASGPDLVAHGVSALDERVTGTSFAAPRVTGLARVVAAAILQLRRAWPGAAPSDEGVRLVGSGIIDAGFERYQREMVPAPALPILGPDADAVSRIADIVASAGIAVDVRGTAAGVRHLLVKAARPVPGCGPHEVGAGFVDQGVVVDHLARLTGLDALTMFSEAGVEDDVREELARHRLFEPDALGSLATVVDATSPLWLFDYREQSLGRVP